MSPILVDAARALHRIAFLRRWAKRIAAGWTITQPFHGGVICLDAVEHSWAWTGTRRLENFEREVQDRLLERLRGRELLSDIGSNIGGFDRSASVPPTRGMLAGVKDTSRP
jgi:hypothetical protein